MIWGRIEKVWLPNQFPVRPKPVMTSSAMSRMSYLSQVRWISGH
jgi:hypothetical protein